jgi:hypothetical protein
MIFKIGDTVYTKKGSRYISANYGGKIVGFGKWKNFKTAKIKKINGTVSSFLLKNLCKGRPNKISEIENFIKEEKWI